MLKFRNIWSQTPNAWCFSLFGPSFWESELQVHIHRHLCKSQLGQVKSSRWIWQVNRDTDPDPTYYCSLDLLQQLTQLLHCPMTSGLSWPRRAAKRLGFNATWLAHGKPYLASYTKATWKPKEAEGISTVPSKPQAYATFISPRPWP